jgi:hypothetical protein
VRCRQAISRILKIANCYHTYYQIPFPFTLKSSVVITDAKPRYKTSYQLTTQGGNARANKTFHFRITSEYTSSSVQDIKLRGNPRNKHITISGPAISASLSQLIAS